MSEDLPRRVVILTHARERRATDVPYQIWGIADLWRAWGVEVVVARGTSELVDADVVVNHVNLTVVPDAYLRAMAGYAVAINGRVADISKRRISRNLLRRGDAWDGRVIVKTDRNCGGMPERRYLLGGVGRYLRDLRLRMSRRPWRVRRSIRSDRYPVFESIAAVPADVWGNPAFVVERFLPERDGDDYVLRTYTFFGTCHLARRSFASVPVVKAGGTTRVEYVDPHPDVIAFARETGLDRGKLDYVVRDGRAVVLDVNKTNTLGRAMTPERRRETCERLAPGLRCFWPPRK